MDDFARLIGGLGLVLLLAACADGYPAGDNPRTAALSVTDHVRALNGYLGAQAGAPRAGFELSSPCVLALKETGSGKVGKLSKSGQPPRREAIDLRTLAVEVKADKAVGGYAVTLLHGAEHSLRAREGFQVEGWIDAVAFRSHLQQLQISCVDEAGGRQGMLAS